MARRGVTDTEHAIIRLAYPHLGPQEISERFMPHHAQHVVQSAGLKLGLKAPKGRPPIDGRQLPADTALAVQRIVNPNAAPPPSPTPAAAPRKRKRRRGIANVTSDELIDYLYTQGLSAGRIANLLGLHSNTVQRRLQTLGTLAKRHARERRLIERCAEDIAESGIATLDAMHAALNRIHATELDRFA